MNVKRHVYGHAHNHVDDPVYQHVLDLRTKSGGGLARQTCYVDDVQACALA